MFDEISIPMVASFFDKTLFFSLVYAIVSLGNR